MLLGLATRLLLVLAVGFSSTVFAAVSVKSTAPESYTVKEGDTLWDIAGLYLDEPWLWPELWRNNIYIQNPHLIYPGNILRLVFNESGEPELLMGQLAEKPVINLSPEIMKKPKLGRAIPLLSWQLIQSHVEQDLVMNKDTYQSLPKLLGDQTGGVRFANDDIVLGTGELDDSLPLMVVRQADEIVNAQGESLGIKIRHVADATLLKADLNSEFLISVMRTNFEVKQGDRIFPYAKQNASEPIIFQAALEQKGQIVGSLQEHSLLGKYDIVVLDLGRAEVTKGTVMGIYMQGPNIVDSALPVYQDAARDITVSALWETVVAQPALKVGELVVFRVFDKASFGLITSSTNIIRHGSIVAKP